jgi:predicted small lipoprotein YifL
MNPHLLNGYTHIYARCATARRCMADSRATRIALLALTLAMLAGCGKTGPLYLPDAASEVVTRPVATPPETESTPAPNSPQTPDSQPAAPAPAPEVIVDESKKEKGASPPPHL